MELSPIKKIIRARIGLQNKTYFLYGTIMHSRYRLTKDGEEAKLIPTACADIRGNIIVNPEFIADAGDDFMQPLIMHEALHIALMHTIQIQHREKMLFNIAADIKVNQYIKEYGYSLDSNWLQANQYGTFEHGNIRVEECDQKSAIQIYDELYKQCPKININVGSGKEELGGSATKHDWQVEYEDGTGAGKELTAEERQRVIRDIKDRIRSAIQSSKMQGSMPAGLERRLNELLKSKIPWQLYLDRLVQQHIPTDLSYRLPHKKSMALGVYMPHVERENVDVILTYDTSGSMTDEALTESLSESFGLASRYPNAKITIIVADCEIHDVFDIAPGNKQKIKEIVMRGGGGTSHVPVYEYIRDNHLKPALIINFTDGYTTFPPQDMVHAPTLWVITTGGIDPSNVPFGRSVKM